MAGRAGAGIGGAAGAPSHGGTPVCGWDQAGLLHLCTLQTRRLKSSADVGRMLVSNGLPAGLEASGADTLLPTFAEAVVLSETPFHLLPSYCLWEHSRPQVSEE